MGFTNFMFSPAMTDTFIPILVAVSEELYLNDFVV